MTAHVLRLPFRADPLIAEAKWRRRRRRLLAAGVALILVAGAIAVGVELNSRGSASVGSAFRTSLTFSAVSDFGRHAFVFHLSCHPPGGDLPQPARACAAIAAKPSLITRPKPFSCWGTWWTFSIIGRLHGRPVHVKVGSCPSRQMALVKFYPRFAER